MKSFKLLLVLPLFFISWSIHGQKLFQLEQIISYPKLPTTAQITQTAFLPKDIPNRHKVLLIEFSEDPLEVIKEDGNTIAKFKIEDLRKGKEIIIRSTILTNNDDFEHASKRKHNPVPLDELKKYLKREPLFQVDNAKVQKQAQEIKGETEEELVRSIFDFVVNHMDYTLGYSQVRGAKKALTSAKGDCTEYSELMITLCRAKGIPARIVAGLTSVGPYTPNPRHNWVEVYFQKYGWIPFDPTFADCRYGNCTTTFDRLKSDYFYFSYDRFMKFNESEYRADYRFRKIDILKDNLDEANNLYENGDYDGALVRLDSFINMGFHPLDYHRLKAKIFSYQGKFKAAQENLLFVEKKSKESKELADYFFTKAIYHALKKENNNAYTNLMKWTDHLYSKRYVPAIVDKEKAFKPLINEKEFRQFLRFISDDYYSSFIDFGMPKTGDRIGFGAPNNIKVKYPFLAQFQIERKYLFEQAKLKKIKSIIEKKETGQVWNYFEFDENGHLIYTKGHGSVTETIYDREGRKKSYSFFSIQDGYSKVLGRYFYEFDQDKLIRISRCEGDCEQQDSKLYYQFDWEDNNKKWKRTEFGNDGNIENWTTYSIDNKNRLIKMEGDFYL